MARSLVNRDTGDEGHAAPTPEETGLYHWRFTYAATLGYCTSDAANLARSHIDLHDVEALLRAGCRHDLAVRIAWPLTGAAR